METRRSELKTLSAALEVARVTRRREITRHAISTMWGKAHPSDIAESLGISVKNVYDYARRIGLTGSCIQGHVKAGEMTANEIFFHRMMDLDHVFVSNEWQYQKSTCAKVVVP